MPQFDKLSLIAIDRLKAMGIKLEHQPVPVDQWSVIKFITAVVLSREKLELNRLSKWWQR